MQSEKLMMIGETVHTDGAQDEIMVGRVIGWSKCGTKPRVKLDKDPSVVSRVGGKQVVECVPYTGRLNEKGLPVVELEDERLMCWVPEYDETGDGLVAEWDLTMETEHIIDAAAPAELTQVQIDQNTEEAEGLADGFGAEIEQQDNEGGDDGDTGSVVGDALGNDDESGSTDDQEESDAQQPQTI